MPDMGDLMSQEERDRLWKSYGPDGPPEGHVIRRLLLTLDQKDGEIDLMRTELSNAHPKTNQRRTT